MYIWFLNTLRKDQDLIFRLLYYLYFYVIPVKNCKHSKISLRPFGQKYLAFNFRKSFYIVVLIYRKCHRSQSIQNMPPLCVNINHERQNENGYIIVLLNKTSFQLYEMKLFFFIPRFLSFTRGTQSIRAIYRATMTFYPCTCYLDMFFCFFLLHLDISDPSFLIWRQCLCTTSTRLLACRTVP